MAPGAGPCHAVGMVRFESVASEAERMTLRAVAEEYRLLSWSLFGDRLRAPTLELTDGGGDLGRWVSHTRTLQLSRPMVLTQPWGVVIEVLKHEMAHQYVDEVLGRGGEAPHGETFQRVCEQRGIDARAGGVPGAGAADPARARLLERVRKLLALAESTSEHEAEVAMRTAQRLMLEHDLEAALRGESSAYAFRHLGEPSGRVEESRKLIGAALTEGFLVRGIWVKVWSVQHLRWGTVLEVCGTSENVEIAAYVHDYLVQTLDALWRRYRQERGLRGNAERRSFQSGVMSGFVEKLRARRKRPRLEDGLVLARAREADGYFRSRHPRTRTMSFGGNPRGQAFWDGTAEGRSLEVRPGVGGAQDGPRLLRGK